MTTDEAFEIVIDLARQNVIGERDNPEEHDRQTEALNGVVEFVDLHDIIIEDYDKGEDDS
jgi:hypothetical protein